MYNTSYFIIMIFFLGLRAIKVVRDAAPTYPGEVLNRPHFQFPSFSDFLNHCCIFCQASYTSWFTDYDLVY